MRAGRHEHAVSRELACRQAEAGDLHGIRSDDLRRALQDRDVVPFEVLVYERPRRLDHGALAIHEIADGDVVLHPQIDTVQAALPQATEVERGLTQRLGGDGPGVDRRAARLRRALHDAHALAEVRGLRRSLLPGGTRADDDEVEMIAHAVGATVSASS